MHSTFERTLFIDVHHAAVVNMRLMQLRSALEVVLPVLRSSLCVRFKVHFDLTE